MYQTHLLLGVVVKQSHGGPGGVHLDLGPGVVKLQGLHTGLLLHGPHALALVALEVIAGALVLHRVLLLLLLHGVGVGVGVVWVLMWVLMLVRVLMLVLVRVLAHHLHTTLTGTHPLHGLGGRSLSAAGGGAAQGEGSN